MINPSAASPDLISLAAFIFHLSQIEAARKIAAAIGIDPHAA
jgi:hypothetical protein